MTSLVEELAMTTSVEARKEELAATSLVEELAMTTLVEAGARTRSPRTEHATETSTRARLGLALGLAAIGIGLAAVGLLGPFAAGVIDYHVTDTLRNQTIGLDAVSLLVVAPLSFLAALLVIRRHVAGAALALGIGAYTTYMLVQYILGPEYERLPGNNELLFRSTSSCSPSAGSSPSSPGTDTIRRGCRAWAAATV
jgi:hypothetical protein